MLSTQIDVDTDDDGDDTDDTVVLPQTVEMYRSAGVYVASTTVTTVADGTFGQDIAVGASEVPHAHVLALAAFEEATTVSANSITASAAATRYGATAEDDVVADAAVLRVTLSAAAIDAAGSAYVAAEAAIKSATSSSASSVTASCDASNLSSIASSAAFKKAAQAAEAGLPAAAASARDAGIIAEKAASLAVWLTCKNAFNK